MEAGGWCTIGEDVSGRPCFAIGAVAVGLDQGRWSEEAVQMIMLGWSWDAVLA